MTKKNETHWLLWKWLNWKMVTWKRVLLEMAELEKGALGKGCFWKQVLLEMAELENGCLETGSFQEEDGKVVLVGAHFKVRVAFDHNNLKFLIINSLFNQMQTA